MPLSLPPKTVCEPMEHSLLCRLYSQSEHWRPDSKIIIPETAQKELFFARVVAKGPGKMVDVDKNGIAMRLPMYVNVGDDVLFHRYHGEEVTVGDHAYIIIRQEDVIAKIKLDPASEMFKFAGKEEINTDALEEARIK